MKTFLELYDELNEKPKGLYYYINKKRKEGRKMRKKGEKGAPKASDFERAAQTAKEDAHTPLDRVKTAHAREKEQDRNRRDRELDRARLQTARQKNTQTTVENAPSLAVLKKKIKSGTKLGSTETASAKARGLIPRADGTKRKSPKYK